MGHDKIVPYCHGLAVSYICNAIIVFTPLIYDSTLWALSLYQYEYLLITSADAEIPYAILSSFNIKHNFEYYLLNSFHLECQFFAIEMNTIALQVPSDMLSFTLIAAIYDGSLVQAT